MLAACLVAPLLLSQASVRQPSGGQNDLQSLVEAERSFARAAAAMGMRDAFIANLADDSVLFRPHAVPGKKWMQESAARPGLLSWQPIHADVSGAGDLGYTTGPWEFRRQGSKDKPIAFGEYVTVWKRQPSGEWKVELDTGIGHAAPTEPAPAPKFSSRTGPVVRLLEPDRQRTRDGLLKADRELSELSSSKGAVAAYASVLGDDGRLFRDGTLPSVGKKRSMASLDANPLTMTWAPQGGDLAVSGDLGYTYGMSKYKPANSQDIQYGNYLRIWRSSGGKWLVVLDLLDPTTPPEGGGQ
jgi:ketosteroid isomerase-like protein